MKFLATLLVLPLFAAGPAFADTVDFSSLTVNGVAPGQTVAQAKGTLGEPAEVKGSKKQFLVYSAGAWNRLTLELDGDSVKFVSNGSSLALDGQEILKIGDPVSRLDTVLPGAPHESREKVDGWDFYYPQAGRMLIVSAKDGKVVDVMMGTK